MKKIMIILLMFLTLVTSLFATGIGVEYCGDFSGEKNKFLEFEIDQTISIYENFGANLKLNFSSELKNEEIIFNNDFEFLGGVSYKDMLFYFKKDTLNFSPKLGLQKKSSLHQKFGVELIIPYIHYYYKDNAVYFQEKKSITFLIEDRIELNNKSSSFFIKEELEFSKIDSFKKNILREEFIGDETNVFVKSKIGFQTGYFKIGVSNIIEINSNRKTKLDLKNTQFFVGFEF